MATLSQAGIAGLGNVVMHPKHKNRWRVIFTGLGGALGNNANVPNDLSLQVVTATRPSISYEEVQLDRYNSRIFVAGKHNFEPCSLTVEDDQTNRATYAVQTQLESQQRLIGASGPWLNTEATAFGYKFGMLLEQLDGNESVVESWKYEGCFLSAVDYGDLDYSTGEKVTITITVRYDHVRQVLSNVVTGSVRWFCYRWSNPRLIMKFTDYLKLSELHDNSNSVVESYDPNVLELLFERLDEKPTVPFKTKLTMSRINTVLLSPNDTGFGHLQDKVYGVRNESPIIEALLELLGVPEDGTPYKIRNGFMKYDKNSKMLFIAKFKYDLPGVKAK